MQARIVLADPHVLFRDAVRSLLDHDGGYQIVAEVGDGNEALEAVEAKAPDLVVIETALPRLPGTEVTRRAKARGSPATFLFLSSRAGKRSVEEAFRAGAVGYVCKEDSLTDLRDAIVATRQGHTYLSTSVAKHLVEIAMGRQVPQGERAGAALTSREQEILQWIAEGLSSKEIAGSLGLSVRTVDSHRANLMDKLGIHRVSGLVRYAIREGLLAP